MYTDQLASIVLDELSVDPAAGLDDVEVASRREKYGENELQEKKQKTRLQMFLSQLNDPMIYILFAAAAISLILREVSDTIIILIVVLINAIIGMVQEGKAQQALEALKKLSSPTALVRRNGSIFEVPAAELVPGDIVLLEAGRQVPADIRLISSSSLKIEESALTGESVPVEKDANFIAEGQLPLGDRINMAYMTTAVSYGRGEGVVVETGMNTQIGNIAAMINEADDEMTPLQKRLADLGKMLGVVAVLLCVALFLIAVFQSRDIPEMLITAISLAVAAVPEGLPAVVTIVLALGVQRLVKVNTIVRRLPSVETLGSVSVVCSDKTGTLTQNKMTVVKCYKDGEIVDAEAMDAKRDAPFINAFVLSNDAIVTEDSPAVGDPTEIALVNMGLPYAISKFDLEQRLPRIDEIPFDSERKMMTTVHQGESGTLMFTKGAADNIILHCTEIMDGTTVRAITEEDIDGILVAVKELSLEALRVLAIACKVNPENFEEDGLCFMGMVGMIDPPRPEAAHAIELFKEASVKTVMITGDHKDTAYAIAKQLGIAVSMDQCITGEELDALSEEEFAAKVDDLCVYARVSPENKVSIVNGLKAKGYIVSMTGDGVNDAPSLKAADIGVAMGITGTDVAKNAADMVLVDDNFATIEKAIEEGRGIYQNIKKSVLFLLSSNFGEIITMFLAILAGLPSPLKAIHILWVNLITDSLPGLALGVDENDTRYIMKQPPRDPKESLFAHGGMRTTVFYGIVVASITLGAFLFTPIRALMDSGAGVSIAGLVDVLKGDVLLVSQTYAFTVLGLSQLFHAIGMRNLEQSVFTMNHLKNKMMIAAFFVGLGLQILVTEVPLFISIFGLSGLSLVEWLWLALVASTPLWVHEILVPFRKLAKRKKV